MEHLLEVLDCILHKLEEIYNISCNQETVIVALKKGPESEETFLKFLEEMVQNKEEVMIELEKLETSFNELYYESKPLLENAEEMKVLKEKVHQVLRIKEQIVDREEKNNKMMGITFKGQVRPTSPPVVAVPKNAGRIIQQYTKFKK